MPGTRLSMRWISTSVSRIVIASPGREAVREIQLAAPAPTDTPSVGSASTSEPEQPARVARSAAGLQQPSPSEVPAEPFGSHMA